jgi:hypothetical protein
MLVTANVFPSSLMLSTLMMGAIHCSKTSVLTRTTWRHIPEDGIPIQSGFLCKHACYGILLIQTFMKHSPLAWLSSE